METQNEGHSLRPSVRHARPRGPSLPPTLHVRWAPASAAQLGSSPPYWGLSSMAQPPLREPCWHPQLKGYGCPQPGSGSRALPSHSVRGDGGEGGGVLGRSAITRLATEPTAHLLQPGQAQLWPLETPPEPQPLAGCLQLPWGSSLGGHSLLRPQDAPAKRLTGRRPWARETAKTGVMAGGQENPRGGGAPTE